MATHTLAAELVSLIGHLKQQHKAGITPSYGQVDDLFDLGERLGVALQAGITVGNDCTVPGCQYAAGEEVSGLLYCHAHAQEARQMLDALRTLMPNVFARVSRVEWPTAPAAPPNSIVRKP